MEQPSLESHIGNYAPTRFLAHWTLGERFIARPIGGGDPQVIIDRLWPELGAFGGFEAELNRIERWRHVHHPAIAQVLEVGMHGGRPFVVSEFFEGRSLEALIQRRESAGEQIPPRAVLDVCVQIAEGLAALHDASAGGHSLGLVHGGINPSRVLVDGKARAKLLGGWSSALEAKLPWAVPPRTVVYQAPEELWHMGNLDGRADIFSLGVVLFEGFAAASVHPKSRSNSFAGHCDVILTRDLGLITSHLQFRVFCGG